MTHEEMTRFWMPIEVVVGFVHEVAFSPNGKWIVSGGGDSDSVIRVWNAQSGASISTGWA